MATVTGLTAARMLAIEAATVVDGSFDSAGHLILERHDGTTFDAGVNPDASSTVKGIVELATSAEVQAGTDDLRAITPAGLASIPGKKVETLASNALAESATPSSYPLGISLMPLTTGSAWTPNSGFGSVVTNRPETDRTVQIFYSNPGGTGFPRSWVRQYHSSNGGGGWTAWSEYSMVATLTSTSFTQTSAFTSYPSGFSRLYYTTSGTGWDFSGTAGEVTTYVNGTDFARQTFFSHASGSGLPGMWVRTANAANGWTAWRKTIFEDQVQSGAWTSWTPTWTTTSGSATPSFGNATVDCKYAKFFRTVHFRMNITFGSTTNFGTSPSSSDNWLFSMPVAAPASGVPVGYVSMWVGSLTKATAGLAHLNSTTQIILYTGSGNVDNSSLAGGIADSVSPLTWANGDRLSIFGTYESAA